MILMLLDSQSRMLYCDVVNEGSVKEAPVYVRRIVSLALGYNANPLFYRITIQAEMRFRRAGIFR